MSALGVYLPRRDLRPGIYPTKETCYQAYPQKGPGTRHTHPLEGTWDQKGPGTRHTHPLEGTWDQAYPPEGTRGQAHTLSSWTDRHL